MRYAFLLIALCSFARAQEYAVGHIPADLRKDAFAVVRMHQMELELRDAGLGRKYYTYAVTILRKEGESAGDFSEYYDPQEPIRSLQATFYDSSGNAIQEMKNADFTDRALVEAGSYGEGRIKLLRPRRAAYPYTVEYTVEKTLKGIIGLPAWVPAEEEYISVEQAVLKVRAPAGQLRHRSFNLPEPVQGTADGGLETFVWTVKNFRGMSPEPYSPPYYEALPLVLLAPNAFSYEKTRGNMGSWSELGKWSAELLGGRDALSPEDLAKVAEIRAAEPDLMARARRLYEYMQSKTRYVSIQYGIGGFQPAPAADVARLGYGDCKALSNYACALMKAGGIEAYYTLVNAGSSVHDRRRVMRDFPGNMFNHVILCLPNQGDTVWLECTNQQIPFGFLGDFTDDRDVLIVTPRGGVIGHTDAYSAEESYRHASAEVSIAPDGSAQARLRTRYGGLQYDDRQGILHLNPEEQRKEMLRRINVSGSELIGYRFDEERGRPPGLLEEIELRVVRYASLAGSRMFLVPNFWNRYALTLPKLDKRRTDILYDRPWWDTDTVTYHLPEGFRPEALPPPVNIESPFGSYFCEVREEDGRLIYLRTLRRHAGRFPPELYPELLSFFQQVAKADKAAAVFVKKS